MLGVPVQTVHISMYERHLVYSDFVFCITKHNGTFRILESFVEHIYHAKGYTNTQLVPSVFPGVNAAGA